MTENAPAVAEGNPEPLAEATAQMSPAGWYGALHLYCDEDGNIPRERLAKLARDLSARERNIWAEISDEMVEAGVLVLHGLDLERTRRDHIVRAILTAAQSHLTPTSEEDSNSPDPEMRP